MGAIEAWAKEKLVAIPLRGYVVCNTLFFNYITDNYEILSQSPCGAKWFATEAQCPPGHGRQPDIAIPLRG